MIFERHTRIMAQVFQSRRFKLIGYIDLDFDGDKEKGVLTSGYVMSLGSIAISWRS